MNSASQSGLSDMKVGIIDVAGNRASYPSDAPYHPDTLFPESPIAIVSSSANLAYRGVRDVLCALGYDEANYGMPVWNPLGWLVKPGDVVFLKPNMIAHKHTDNDDWDYVITHGSVIRAVIDYVYVALHGRGRIVIGDAPQTDSCFEKIVDRMGLPDLRNLYRKEKNFEIEIVDLRHEHWVDRDGIYVDTEILSGDPAGTLAIDLGGHSMFKELDGQGKRYYGAYYDVDETNEHHINGKHEYCISRSPVVADVFISLPKMKTHKKCGITLNLKGLVGINGNKNWLPHYIFGSPETGGDQFPKMSPKGSLENWLVGGVKHLLLQRNSAAQLLARKSKKAAYRFFGKNEETVRSGNWHGNDTVWRMSVDLNRILLYAQPDGSMGTVPKRYFSVVDGIVGMEGNGPVAGTRRVAGIIGAGANPVAVDAAFAALMGFDYRRLPLLARAFEFHEYPLVLNTYESIECVGNREAWLGSPAAWNSADRLGFHPHFAWVNQIEYEVTS